ncbi:MAG: mechanosensitive ion channel [Bacteroidetes bacterium]|nr:mechanosensitive ion channel [Bacteroidota bacterium]
MDQVIKILISLTGSAAVIVLLFVFLFLNKWLFNRIKKDQESFRVTKQSIAALIILAGGITFILSLPIDQSLKGQILSFLGIIISAAIALSSTTLLGNLIAGIMNNSMNRFKLGDLIKVGDLMGRVTRKNILHTEIQLEDSNFVTIPNLHIASNPVKLTRKNNTVISTTVSLGYDVSQRKIMESLKNAAAETGLNDPYVYITNLGDFSVTYKIHGFLEDSTKYFSTSSLLNSNVISALHDSNIEIVSPTFMNQRQVNDTVFIPKQEIVIREEEPDKSPEDLIFDKATEAGAIEKKKEYLNEITEKIEDIQDQIKDLKDKIEIENLKKKMERLKNIQKKILDHIDEKTEQLDEKD